MKPEKPNNEKKDIEPVEMDIEGKDTSINSVSDADLIPLSPKAFIKALQGETVIDENGVEQCFLTEDYDGEEDIVVCIKNIVVESDIIIEEFLSFTYLISLKNNIFLERFLIEGGEFMYDFEVENCVFQGVFIIEGGNFEEDFWIFSGDFQTSFLVRGGNFLKGFFINDGNFKYSFEISGGDFQDALRIGNGNFPWKFIITSGNFNSHFWILGGIFANFFEISGGQFHKEVEILGGNFQGVLGITGGDFQEDFKIENSKGFINEFRIFNKINYNLSILPDSNINQLFFNNDIEENAVVKINNLSVNSLVLRDCQNFGFLALTNFRFSTRKIYKLKDSRRKFELTTEPIAPQIEITNSFLGNTKFQSVHFESADKIIIDNTDINDASIRGEYFPMSTEKVYSDKEGNRVKSRLADIYNDLANMMRRQGNHILSTDYAATYKSLLRQHIWENWNKEHFRDKVKYVNLKLEQVSNLHGISWLWALGFTIITSYAFYIIYTACSPLIEFCIECPNEKPFLFGVQQYLDFALLSLFRMNFSEEPNTFTLLFSILGKLTFAYGVYQFVQAFRRLGRR